jgi:hypothetical protein
VPGWQVRSLEFKPNTAKINRNIIFKDKEDKRVDKEGNINNIFSIQKNC